MTCSIDFQLMTDVLEHIPIIFKYQSNYLSKGLSFMWTLVRTQTCPAKVAWMKVVCCDTQVKPFLCLLIFFVMPQKHRYVMKHCHKGRFMISFILLGQFWWSKCLPSRMFSVLRILYGFLWKILIMCGLVFSSEIYIYLDLWAHLLVGNVERETLGVSVL